jgi:putative ABC transport system permease protein
MPSIPFAVSPPAVAASITMSLAVGMVSGFLPARRAAGLDPVEALRTE